MNAMSNDMMRGLTEALERCTTDDDIRAVVLTRAGDYGGTWFMTKLIGSGRTRELYFLNDRVPAQRALEIGLANWVFPAADLHTKTHELAVRLASGPTKTLGMMKTSLVAAEQGD